MVHYIGTARVRELVARVGVARFMEALAGEIEQDYLRWGEFEKSSRHASHSANGVIELMPTSDGRLYSFKYVNGHPKNTAAGLLRNIGVTLNIATTGTYSGGTVFNVAPGDTFDITGGTFTLTFNNGVISHIRLGWW